MALLNLRRPRDRRAAEQLSTELIVWFTTVNPRGQPQSSPVWFLWDGDTFLIFSRPGARKLTNIQKNAKVGLNLRGTDDGGELVIFEGRARVLARGRRADRVPAYIEKYRPKIEEYGWTVEEFAADYSVPIRVSPTRVRLS